jgi:dTDP-4-dehydrorhamnose reductase
MKVLINGANGQVGSSIAKIKNFPSLKLILVTRKDWDMALSPNDANILINKHKPDLIINAAAYTDVEKAETEKNIAINVNSLAVKALSRAASEIDIPIFHISTDYVFDGNKDTSYVEGDETNPLNVYGLSKLDGEKYLLNENNKSLIIRTSWVFAADKKNFVNSMLNLFITKSKINVIDDQIGGPTSADSIAYVLMIAAYKYSIDKDLEWGVYHFSGADFVSWFEFANFICSNLNNLSNKYAIKEIARCSTEDFNTIAKRPKNSCLNSSKICNYLGIEPCDWKNDVRNLIQK